MEITGVRRRKEVWGRGGGAPNHDGPTSTLAILTCKDRLFTRLFSNCFSSFFYFFFFFSSFNDSDVGRLSERKREQRGSQYAK